MQKKLIAPGQFLNSLETLKTRMMFNAISDEKWLNLGRNEYCDNKIATTLTKNAID